MSSTQVTGAAPQRMTEAEFRSLYDRLRAQVPWGPDDRRGALGLHLMDYLQFDDLAPLCEREGRWSFLCVIAPLRLPTGTGSPVNPIAIL